MMGRGLRSGPRDSQTRVSQCHVPDFVGLFVQLLTHRTLTEAAIVPIPTGCPGRTGRERESLSVCLKLSECCLYQRLLPSRPLTSAGVSLIPALSLLCRVFTKRSIGSKACCFYHQFCFRPSSKIVFISEYGLLLRTHSINVTAQVAALVVCNICTHFQKYII